MLLLLHQPTTVALANIHSVVTWHVCERARVCAYEKCEAEALAEMQAEV